MSHFLFPVCTNGRLAAFYQHKAWTRERVAVLLLPSPVASPGYLAGDWRVESRCLSYILPHRFSVRDESHRIGRSFKLGGIPKDTSIIIIIILFYFFTRGTEPTLFIYCLSDIIIKIPNQVLTTFLPLPQTAASPSQVTPSKVPSDALRSKLLKDLFDIERGRIISPSLKWEGEREMRRYNACRGWRISGQLRYRIPRGLAVNPAGRAEWAPCMFNND